MSAGQGVSNQTLYVKNLNRRLPIREVKRRLGLLVSRYARVSKIKMSDRPGMLGQAFVHLEETSAEEALNRINGMFFLGRIISVSFAHSEMCIGSKREPKMSKTLIVTEISDSLNKQDIEKIFSKVIGLRNIRFVRVKNLAFIDFVSVEDASAAYAQLGECIGYNGELMKMSPSL